MEKIFVVAIFGANAEPTECLGFACTMNSNICDICRLNPEVRQRRFFKKRSSDESMSMKDARDYMLMATTNIRGRATRLTV